MIVFSTVMVNVGFLLLFQRVTPFLHLPTGYWIPDKAYRASAIIHDSIRGEMNKIEKDSIKDVLYSYNDDPDITFP